MSFFTLVRPVSRKQVGQRGERVACRYLKRRGFTHIVSNWRCRYGEIDLVMEKGSELVFVEVKTRIVGVEARELLFATVDRRKQLKLQLLAEVFVRQSRCPELPRYRIDLIGVLLRPNFRVQEVVHEIGAV